MSIVLALIAALVGAALGLAAGAALGNLLAPILSISRFEGEAGYFAALLGLLGGIAGFIAFASVTLRYQGGFRGFGAIARRVIGLAGLAAALAAVVMVIRLATVEHFSGASPQMQFEIRLPAQARVPERRRVDIEMQAGSQRSGALFRDDWLRQDGDRAVIRGLVPLYTRTSQRMLVLTLPDTPKLLFNIRLGATPKTATDYGAWQRVDALDDGKAESQPRKPRADEDYEIRYFVAE
jgi:hypothetical protein